jgi:mannose-6-phosphate isomerase-like protein (cupin superfamily)
MHIFSKAQVTTPFDSGAGELVYEILGRSFPGTTDRHSVAYIHLRPGKASQKHFHPVAEESYYILKGTAHLQIGAEGASLSPGQVVLIPPGQVHQISNPGEEDLEFLAICVPAWEPQNSEYLP